jgi:hypothetical protein
MDGWMACDNTTNWSRIDVQDDDGIRIYDMYICMHFDMIFT